MMMKRLLTFFALLIAGLAIHQPSFALADTVPPRLQKSIPNPNSPRKAIIHSAIIPGWGQADNKKYWKIPIVYGALGTTTYLFFRNWQQYKDSRLAYQLATDTDPLNDAQIIEPYYSVRNQPERIRVFRNQVRQNMDYCVLFFIAFWGLNVVDAAVDAHLKSFDVSDKLSIHLKTGYSEIARNAGMQLILNIR